MRKLKFPNGKSFFCIDKYSPKVIYHELYGAENIYLRKNIKVDDGDTVFDIGANIGLFSIYLTEQYRDLTVYTFEPIPDIFKALEANTAGAKGTIINENLGLADREGTVDFYYYPGSTVYSSLHPLDLEKQRQLILDNYEEFRKGIPLLRWLPGSLKHFIAFLILANLKHTKRSSKITTISRIIEKYNIQQIDLLKLDAENSEAEVIAGISEPHWERIKQISMEVHGNFAVNRKSHVVEIRNLLREKGFSVTIESDDLMHQCDIAMLYAIRDDATR